MILGIDEVGRGAWAGPLVMGAVVLGGVQLEGLTDSKLLTKKRREKLDEEIRSSGAGVGLGWVWPDEIDEMGLGPALHVAARRAVEDAQSKGVAFHEIIIDGTINFLSDTPLETYVSTMKKADLLVPSVSAASIVAKVARDQYMSGQDERYGFASHVGYGTAAHRAAIEEYGVSPQHRLSIAPLVRYRSTAERRTVSEGRPTTRAIGNDSESVAALELQRRGHEILERNWRTKWCEIDIVSRKNDTVYFVEVKHRKTDASGSGMEAITTKKLQQMKFAAELYGQRHALKQTNLQLMAIATAGVPPQIVDVLEIV